MKKYIWATIAAIFSSVIVVGLVGYWWIGLRDTGNLDDGVAVLSQHRAQIDKILHYAAAHPTLDVVVIYDSGQTRCYGKPRQEEKIDCAPILQLMRTIPIRDAAFLHEKNTGRLVGADLVIFKGSILRRPVEAFWGTQEKVHPADSCKVSSQGWRICPGDFGWM